MMGTHRSMLHKARWGIAVGGWLLGSLAWAQSAIESVSGSIHGGTEVVRIELSEALAADPTGFPVSGAHRTGFSRRHQWHGQIGGRAQSGQPALHQYRRGFRPRTPGAEPEDGDLLPY